MLELKDETKPLVPAAAAAEAQGESTLPAVPAVPSSGLTVSSSEAASDDVLVESSDVPKEVSWAGKTERLCCVVM